MEEEDVTVNKNKVTLTIVGFFIIAFAIAASSFAWGAQLSDIESRANGNSIRIQRLERCIETVMVSSAKSTTQFAVMNEILKSINEKLERFEDKEN